MSAHDGGLDPYRSKVAAEWIDYNGHMSEAFYVLVFGHATDQAMEALGLDSAYREQTACSLYTVEAHVRYLREVSLGAPLTVHTRVVGSGAKKLHLAHEMHSRGTVVATEEILALHVDQSSGSTTAFPAQVLERIASLTGEPPDWCGRRVG